MKTFKYTATFDGFASSGTVDAEDIVAAETLIRAMFKQRVRTPIKNLEITE